LKTKRISMDYQKTTFKSTNFFLQVTPDQGINEASFMIRVKEPTLLDFEVVNVLNFTIVAREVVENKPKESRASVHVHIRDVNDNSPEFSTDSYEVYVSENVAPGGTLAWIRAEDKDSGILGSAGIRYTGLSGPLAAFLELDKKSGIVSLSPNAVFSPFDREKSDFHYLTVEARDDLGRGNRNTVELLVHLTDVNDNPPRFDRDEYNIHLKENSVGFNQPFIVSAHDDDENGTENSVVRYRIVRGDTGGNFSIDVVTGEITPNGVINYENMMGDGDGNRVFNLTVRAFDLGTPPLFSDAYVKVFVQDVNDFDPVFQESYYRVSLAEDSKSGAEVVAVRALDRDGSSPFNEVVYRITSGAKDKFVIEADTGKVLVSRGASLDPDFSVPRTTSYFMEITAFDGGIGDERRLGKTHVNITIDDVNNKVPVFNDDSLLPLTILENVDPGYFVRRVVANDPDLTSQLRFYIDANKSESRNENGILLPNLNITELFAIDQDSGDITVSGDLDREVVQDIKLTIIVEDVKADIIASQFRPQISRSSLFITILDINDNNPMFKKNIYSSVLNENVPKDSEILTISAEDIDKNRTVVYNLEGSLKILKILDIEPMSGKVIIREKLDYEKVKWLNFTVRAMDSGVPSRSNYADVNIAILDENDHSPTFIQASINITVREDTPPDTIVAKLHAIDKDSGEFGKVTYFLDRNSAIGRFKIHPDTGELSIGSEPIDRENQDKFNLIIQAYDNYHFGFPTGESRNSFAQVSVLISDVNDESPIFEVEAPTLHGCAIITEFHDQNEPILTARAQDADDPRTPNGVVAFTIKAGNEQKLFMIEPNGRVYPSKALKGFYGNYTITVEASDQGHPANTATKKFPICIQVLIRLSFQPATQTI
jgi:cadherin 23